MGFFSDGMHPSIFARHAPTHISVPDSDQAQAYNQVTQRPHEAEWSHE